MRRAAAYGSAEAAVKAIEAGADMLLMPGDFKAAYNGVIEATNCGRISEERLDESLRRIISLKMKIMNEDIGW